MGLLFQTTKLAICEDTNSLKIKGCDSNLTHSNYAIQFKPFVETINKIQKQQGYMDVLNPADRAINNANFVAAAKMIEFSNIQPSLVEGIVKQELEKKRLKYAYPAVIGNAKIHRDAYKFGYSQSRRGQSPRVCPCCLERVQTESIGLCYRTTHVDIEEQMGYSEFKLRPGIALFFSFIKMLVVFFIFRFLLCDGFNLITNIVAGQYCNDDTQTQCYPILWNLVSIYNKKNNQKFILITDILSLVLVVLSILFFFFYRKDQYGKAQLLNNKNQVEEDYTILVQNIPLIDFPSKAETKKIRTNQVDNMELYHRQHLWKYFEAKVKGWIDKRKSWSGGSNQTDFQNLLNKNNGELRSNEIVKSISLCYNLQRLQTLQRERDELVRNHKKYEKLRRELEDQPDDSSLGIMQVESDNRFSSISKQVDFLNDCQIILNKQYASDNSVLFNITNFVGKAFISFQYQHYRQYILEEADRDLNFLVFNGSRLKVSRVPNPRDIYWKNLRHPQSKQKKKLATTLYVLGLITLICFGILSALQFGRIRSEQSLKVDQNSVFGKFGSYGFSILSVVIILIIDQIIMVMARKRTKQQCHYSRTQQSLSIIFKVVIFRFICTAILPFVVSRIFGSKIADKTGLIFQMTILIIGYGLIINILSLVFPKALLRSCLLMCRYNGKKPEDTVEKFQVELNKQYQYPQFDIINQYANFILLVFTAAFYAYLIPITIPILAAIFFLQFWIDKINLFRRCSHPRSFSFYLTRNVLKIFEACIWVFAVGTCIFGTYVHDQKINIINLVTLGIASIYLWFLLAASIKLERRMFGNYQSSQSALYDDCASSGKFEETFWTSNPATYLIKESDVTGRQTIMNPGLNKIFVTQSKAH